MFLAQSAHGISNESLRDQVIAHHISRPLQGGCCRDGISQALAHLRQPKALVFEFERFDRFFSTKDKSIFIFDKPL